MKYGRIYLITDENIYESEPVYYETPVIALSESIRVVDVEGYLKMIARLKGSNAANGGAVATIHQNPVSQVYFDLRKNKREETWVCLINLSPNSIPVIYCDGVLEHLDKEEIVAFYTNNRKPPLSI